MTYCELSDVYPLIPTLGTLRDASTGPPAVTATVPSATQAAALVAACEAEVLGVIAAAGYSLPITDAEALAYVQSVISYGSAAFILTAKYPAAAGQGGDAGASTFWAERYAAGLEALGGGAIGDTPRVSGTVSHGFKDSAGTALSTSELVTRIGRETEF
jgi:hypothetical protein